MRLFFLLLMTATCAAEEIPLSKVVSTSGQQDLKHVFRELETITVRGARNALDEVRRSPNGASNVFLVDAGNFAESLIATNDLVVGGRSAEKPVSHRDPSGMYWCVVYLGIGPSSPTWWTVEDFVVVGGTIRLTYHRETPSMITADLHPYWYWIPVGAIEPGRYTLELFDTTTQDATLTRRVRVE